MDLGSTSDEIQCLFASRVPKTDHENEPTLPWVPSAVLARMEKVTSALIHFRPCRAHRTLARPVAITTLADRQVPVLVVVSRVPSTRFTVSAKCGRRERSASGRAPGTRQPDLERDNAANSSALAGGAMPRSPSECADVGVRSAGATMPQRRPRLLRSRTPGPACEAQPPSPAQRPRLPESRQFHSSSDDLGSGQVRPTAAPSGSTSRSSNRGWVGSPGMVAMAPVRTVR